MCANCELVDPKFRWFDSNSEFPVHHFDITRADWILTGEISIDYRDARLITLEQFAFVMHQGMSVFSLFSCWHES